MTTHSPSSPRRRALLAASLLPLLAGTPALASDPWPRRAIKWVVPYLAGTGPDTTARIVAEAVSKELGQPVVIENRGGVGGNLGARQVAKAAPDGYTWIYSGSPMAASMRMYKAPGYDVLKDFRHVIGLTSSDTTVIVHASSDIRTLEQLLTRMRAQPGKIDYASGGIGTPSHLGVEMLLSVAQAEATHVPYKGASEIVNAVMGQQVTFGAPITSVAYANIQAGKLRALAVTGPRRNPKLPGVPTLAELQVPGVELTSWGGVSVPTGTPDAIVARVRSALDAALRQPAVVSALEEQGGQVFVQDSEAFTRAFGKEIAFTETMMKRARLEPM
ncbi:tripartite tricarboxylate transporter substrate binding protein [Acidovorax sp. sif1233]|uniref:Bug family tripartite tricarboxylate transporter substrate binding protein n=1 Tax=Acidovorax sp. sif1233 TaxID=2854792 RepID=UPI001C44B9C0|nr:tripartite tricarboxylate transporter substrate binding protein [Acidovorax sp. sif1233]MBV7454443.1 tripartite tricarboxylate transporter substrate binding protein [Acidovorax sp. sif1233]